MQVVLVGVDLEKDEVYDQVIPVENAIVLELHRESPFALQYIMIFRPPLYAVSSPSVIWPMTVVSSANFTMVL